MGFLSSMFRRNITIKNHDKLLDRVTRNRNILNNTQYSSDNFLQTIESIKSSNILTTSLNKLTFSKKQHYFKQLRIYNSRFEGVRHYNNEKTPSSECNPTFKDFKNVLNITKKATQTKVIFMEVRRMKIS